MQVTSRHGPASAVARVVLDPDEAVQVHSGAMMAVSADVAVEGGAPGALVTTYTASAAGGMVDVAGFLPGDVVVLEVRPDRTLLVHRRALLAAATTVALVLDAEAEAEVVVRCVGEGSVVAACYGATEVWELRADEQLVVDAGHLVAYTDDVGAHLRAASGDPGEHLVFEFTGPGQVVTQTRNLSALTEWLTSVLPIPPRRGE